MNKGSRFSDQFRHGEILMASRSRPWMVAVCGPDRPAIKPVAAIALSLLLLGSVRAEVVFSNLNTDPSPPSASFIYGFSQYAQRFTTGSAGTGLHLDLNIISGSGSPAYDVELWSATGSGTNSNLDALLAPIGSGTVSTTDATALTSFDLTYSLDASTDYFVKLTSSADLVWVIGPSSSTTLNSVLRYGVANLNGTDPSIAGAMKVDVVAVPEPVAMALAGIACGGVSMWRRRRPQA